MRYAFIIPHWLFGLALLLAVSACGVREGGLAPVEMKGSASRDISSKPGAGSQGYQVQRGDTVYALARKFDVPVKALIDANQIQPPYALVVGQKIQVPRQKIHTVETGDTLYGVSRRYGVDVSALVRANNLQEPYGIKVGQKLTLPSPVITNETVASAAQAAPVVNEAMGNKESGETLPPAASSAPVRPTPPPTTPPPTTPPPTTPPPAPQTPTLPAEAVSQAEETENIPETPPLPPEKPIAQPAAPSLRSETIRQPPPPPPRAGKAFAWPVRGRVIATFGSQGHGLHNDGINIQAPKGTPVRAAENGVVAYAGGEIKGFGNLLLIRHADGYMTAYAHNEALLVKRGDVVRRGQVISRVGATGNVDLPQLHFEVRKGAQAIDPEQMLGNPSVS